MFLYSVLDRFFLTLQRWAIKDFLSPSLLKQKQCVGGAKSGGRRGRLARCVLSKRARSTTDEFSSIIDFRII